jgi:hypothetical protein
VQVEQQQVEQQVEQQRQQHGLAPEGCGHPQPPQLGSGPAAAVSDATQERDQRGAAAAAAAAAAAVALDLGLGPGALEVVSTQHLLQGMGSQARRAFQQPQHLPAKRAAAAALPSADAAAAAAAAQTLLAWARPGAEAMWRHLSPADLEAAHGSALQVLRGMMGAAAANRGW